MAHKTLIGGTAYEISGGKTLINGTGYNIAGGRTLIGGTGYDISFFNAIKASDLAVGTTVYLMENGSAVPYLVVHKGNPSTSIYDSSCNGVWLLRKDIYTNGIFGGFYNTSTVHSYLNNTFINVFDSVTKNTIKQVKIPYHTLKGTYYDDDREGEYPIYNLYSRSSGLSTKVFILSVYEMGFTNSNDYNGALTDGAKLSYFPSGESKANFNKRVAYLNGKAARYWTRSVAPYSSPAFFFHREDYSTFGTIYTDWYSSSNGVRPALILPTNAVFDPNTMQLLGVA